jgi:hypothetical protein
MNEEEDWVMRPVLEGLCRYESLIDGTIGLVDIARMNEALEIRDENQARVNEAQEDAYRG